jgi:hypothetical protein
MLYEVTQPSGSPHSFASVILRYCTCRKKNSLKNTRKPELHDSVQNAKQLKLANKKHSAISLCLKSQLHNPEAYSEYGTSCNDRRMGFRFPAGAQIFFSPSRQAGWVIPLTNLLYTGSKRTGPFNAEIKNEWSYASNHPYVLTALRLAIYRLSEKFETLTAVTHLLITKYILKLAGICCFCNVNIST